jgi:hypothetical protein
MKNETLIMSVAAVILFVGSVFFVRLYFAPDAVVVATPEEVEQPIPDVVIKVDNVGCHIAEVPVITYYVATDTARVTIECDSDILFNYLPAIIDEVK